MSPLMVKNLLGGYGKVAHGNLPCKQTAFAKKIVRFRYKKQLDRVVECRESRKWSQRDSRAPCRLAEQG
jgi:hypothetical protein